MNALPTECLEQAHQQLAAVWTGLSADILRYLTKSPENEALGDNLKTRLSAFLTPELLCLFLYRIAHYLYVNGWGRAALFVTRLNFLFHKVSITPQSCIAPGCRLSHPAGVTFHGRAGPGLTLYSLAICGSRHCVDGPVETGPRLGARVTVGAHAVLLGPITVGDDTKIAFSVRLDRDVAARALVICKSLRQARRPTAATDAAPAT